MKCRHILQHQVIVPFGCEDLALAHRPNILLVIEGTVAIHGVQCSVPSAWHFSVLA